MKKANSGGEKVGEGGEVEGEVQGGGEHGPSGSGSSGEGEGEGEGVRGPEEGAEGSVSLDAQTSCVCV